MQRTHNKHRAAERPTMDLPDTPPGSLSFKTGRLGGGGGAGVFAYRDRAWPTTHEQPTTGSI